MEKFEKLQEWVSNVITKRIDPEDNGIEALGTLLDLKLEFTNLREEIESSTKN